MCVYSMVVDHYQDRFRPWIQPPYGPTDPFPLAPLVPSVPVAPVVPTPEQAAALQKMIKEFYEALEAAKKVDKLTSQPDCEDPEKARLVARVAALEKQLAARKGRKQHKRKPRAAPPKASP